MTTPLTTPEAHEQARAIMSTAHEAMTALAAKFAADNPGAVVPAISGAIAHLRYGPYGPENPTPFEPLVPITPDGQPVPPSDPAD